MTGDLFFQEPYYAAAKRSCGGIVLVFSRRSGLPAGFRARLIESGSTGRGTAGRGLSSGRRQATGELDRAQGRRLGAIFNRQGDGLQLLSLFDLAKHRQLLAEKAIPLFIVTMRQVESKEEVSLRADAGWEQVQLASAPKPGTHVELCWQTPKDKRLPALRVTVLGSLDEATGAMRWKLNVDRVEKPWSVRRVVFPQLALDASSPQFEFFYPKGPGQLKRAPWPPQFSYGGRYPQGWIAMQFMAAYDKEHGTGLYYAMHDPLGGIKEISRRLAAGRPGRCCSASRSRPRTWMSAATGMRRPARPCGRCCTATGSTRR